jgi:hypothetical protein
VLQDLTEESRHGAPRHRLRCLTKGVSALPARADLERRTFFGLPAVPARPFGSSDGESDQPDDEEDQRKDPQQLQRESSRAEDDDQ